MGMGGLPDNIYITDEQIRPKRVGDLQSRPPVGPIASALPSSR